MAMAELRGDETGALHRSQPEPNPPVVKRGSGIGADGLAAAGEYLIAEGTLMTTVHLLAVDTERCGSYLSAKALLRLLRGVRLWSDSFKGIDRLWKTIR